MSKIFIYLDREGASRIWQINFMHIANEMGIPTVVIAFDSIFNRPKSPNAILRKIKKKYRSGDKFIARFNERRDSTFKSIYLKLGTIFGTRNIFPDRLAVDLYNNKRLQAEFFQDKDYPTPVQKWIESEAELDRFMQASTLTFPIVRKESRGSASAGVSLIHTHKTRYPFLAQEFCAHNSGDIRVMVVGNMVFGFARANRPDDFRASGSGRIEYIDDLPQVCVETAHRISRECGFVCMAYDFILNNRHQWVIAELSYTFVSDPAARCQYYYDAEQGFAKKRQRVGSVERLILESIMAAGA